MQDVIFIGVGHGYDPKTNQGDVGAVCGKYIEADLNLAVATACADELRKKYKVVMSRTRQEPDTVDQEIDECNKSGATYAVDIHFNSHTPGSSANGFEVFHSIVGGDSKRLAETIVNYYVSKTKCTNRGSKTRQNTAGKDYYGFIRETRCPAVIVEMEFVTNAEAMERYSTPDKLREKGIILARAIDKFLGGTQVDVTTPGTSTPPNPSNSGNGVQVIPPNTPVKETRVLVDGKSRMKGYIVNGRTMVGARDICDALGLSIDFLDGEVLISSK